jgi:hypothetical protein
VEVVLQFCGIELRINGGQAAGVCDVEGFGEDRIEAVDVGGGGI